MRLAHITDIHVARPAGLADLFNKRVLGVVNLHLLGRGSHFSQEVQAALPGAVLATCPDQILCTGDLTSTATEAEFEGVKSLLAPLATLPFHCIPGNHDVYTEESLGRYERYFGPKSVRRFDLGPLDLCLADVCEPDWLSRGFATEATLKALDASLGSSDRRVILGVHYPLRDRRGNPYGPSTRALRNADAIEAIIARHAHVVAVLHGHEHHGFRTTLGGCTGTTGDGERCVPILDPGAAGYSHLPKRGRTAHFNVYEVDATGIGVVERYAWDGSAFVPEHGGAYATGG